MTTADVEERNELSEVEAWRRQALLRAGYDERAAAAIATRPEVDLHGAVDLVERGCPPDVAARILL